MNEVVKKNGTVNGKGSYGMVMVQHSEPLDRSHDFKMRLLHFV